MNIIIDEATAYTARDACWDAAKESRQTAKRALRSKEKAEAAAKTADDAEDFAAGRKAREQAHIWGVKREMAEKEAVRRMQAFGAICSALRIEFEKEENRGG